MVFKLIIGATCSCLMVLYFNSNAALVERLGGLAYYDTEADLTWLTDANASAGSIYDDGSLTTDGNMSWQNANDWAASLNVAGVTNWRLPDTLLIDESCDSYTSDNGPRGANCTGSELGNMFYNVLGGAANSSIFGTHNSNYVLFSNIQPSGHFQPGFYWTRTETTNTRSAWWFGFKTGTQGTSFKDDDRVFAWAVHDGDVSTVPVPAAMWLFGSGLISLIGFAKCGEFKFQVHHSRM